ncbi:MAG: hypothetical protein JKY60_20140 [Kordiimonadaceae bacterium]|nr:hypothetical protein [Kordiimonadaceae bacterium]
MKNQTTAEYHCCPKCDTVFLGSGFYEHVMECKGKPEIDEDQQLAVIHHYTFSYGTLYRSNGEVVCQT